MSCHFKRKTAVFDKFLLIINMKSFALNFVRHTHTNTCRAQCDLNVGGHDLGAAFFAIHFWRQKMFNLKFSNSSHLMKNIKVKFIQRRRRALFTFWSPSIFKFIHNEHVVYWQEAKEEICRWLSESKYDINKSIKRATTKNNLPPFSLAVKTENTIIINLCVVWGGYIDLWIFLTHWNLPSRSFYLLQM
jgi:hypothetical protein